MANNDVKMRFKATDKTAPAFGKIRRNLDLTNKSLFRLKGAFAAAFSIAAITRFGKESLSLADAIGKTADSIGVNVEFLQRYQFVAQQAGLSTEEFNKSMQVFAKMTGEAMTGVGEAKMALESLGVSLRTQDGRLKTTEQLFIDFFKATDNIANAQKKAAFFADVFGRAGVKNTVMAKEGTAAMIELSKAATGVFSEESIRNAEKFNDTMNRLSRQIVTPMRDKLITFLGSLLDVGEATGVLSFDVTTASLSELQTKAASVIDQMNILQAAMQSATSPDHLKMLVLQYKELAKQLEPIRNKIIALSPELQNLGAVNETAFDRINAAMTSYVENLGTVEERTQKAAVNSMKKFEDTLVNSLKQGKLEFKHFADYVVEQLLRIAIQQMLLAPFQQMFAPMFAGFSDFLSFDNGGYTGAGARTGGIDGKGGFPAILHPNETVIDHNKGQAMAASPVSVSFNISTVDASGFDQLLASRKGMITAMINNAMNARGKMGVI
jgi:hypothetical protein